MGSITKNQSNEIIKRSILRWYHRRQTGTVPSSTYRHKKIPRSRKCRIFKVHCTTLPTNSYIWFFESKQLVSKQVINHFFKPFIRFLLKPRPWLPSSTKGLVKTNPKSPNSMGLYRFTTVFTWTYGPCHYNFALPSDLYILCMSSGFLSFRPISKSYSSS